MSQRNSTEETFSKLEECGNSYSAVLKTVNPFDYIKSRSRLEKSTDLVVSFREKLRLDETLETEKLKKLFSTKVSKEFEQNFFKYFHPVKDSKIFLAEPFGEQKSSSRLMSPVVCSKVLDWILRSENVNLFVESVALALLSSGHVSLYTNSGVIIDKIIELKSGSLLLSLLHGFSDLSDSGLTKLILFLISEDSSKIFIDFEEFTDFKFNTTVSVSETCFLALLAAPKSVQLIKKYFLLVKETEIIFLLDRLVIAFKFLFVEKTLKISSNCLVKAPSAKQIVDWISVIIDSQYPLCLIQPKLLKSIESANEVISQEVSLNSILTTILPSIKEVRHTKPLDEKQQKIQMAIKISPSYIIESSSI